MYDSTGDMNYGNFPLSKFILKCDCRRYQNCHMTKHPKAELITFITDRRCYQSFGCSFSVLIRMASFSRWPHVTVLWLIIVIIIIIITIIIHWQVLVVWCFLACQHTWHTTAFHFQQLIQGEFCILLYKNTKTQHVNKTSTAAVSLLPSAYRKKKSRRTSSKSWILLKCLLLFLLLRERWIENCIKKPQAETSPI